MRNYNPYDVMKRQHIDLYLRLLFLFLGTLAAILSLKTYVSDSEFWAITASRQLGEAGASSSIYMKFLFYGLLKPIYALPLDDISHVLVARLEFAAIGAITAYVFYRVARHALDDEFFSLVLTLILLSSTYYLSQSFRVRSDNLSSFLTLIVLWVTIRWKKSEGENWFLPALSIFALNLLLLIATPKSFYFLVIGALFAGVLPFAGLSGRRKALAIGVAFLSPPFAISSAIQLAKVFPMFRWIERASLVGMEYFNDSFRGLAGDQSYLSLADFSYLISFLSQNPFHVLFFFASFVLWFIGWKRLSEDREKFAYFVLFESSLLLLIFHNQKLPFFIYAMLPFLTLGAGVAWKDRFATLRRPSKGRVTILALTSLAVLSTLWVTAGELKYKSNGLQMSTLAEIQSLLQKNPGVKYYDAIGLFPRSNVMFNFPSPNDRNNPVIMKVVENAKPEMIIYVEREFQLEPRMSFFLSESYVDFRAGVWVRAVLPKKIAPLVSHTPDGSCHVTSSGIRSLTDSAFGPADKAVYRLIELDLGGYRSTLAENVSNEKAVSWKCTENPVALIRVVPVELKTKMDTRFVFGFDIVPGSI